MSLLLPGLNSDDNPNIAAHHDNRDCNQSRVDPANVHHMTSPAVSQASYLAERMSRLAATSYSDASGIQSSDKRNPGPRRYSSIHHTPNETFDAKEYHDDDDDGDATCNDCDPDDDGLDLILSMLDNDKSDALITHTRVKPLSGTPMLCASPSSDHTSKILASCNAASANSRRAAARSDKARRSHTSEASRRPDARHSDTPTCNADVSEFANVARDATRREATIKPEDEIGIEVDVDEQSDGIDAIMSKAWTYREDSVVADVFTSVCPDRQRAELARRMPSRLWQEARSRFQTICMSGWQQHAEDDDAATAKPAPAAPPPTCPVEKAMAMAMDFGRRVVEWRANHRNRRSLRKPQCIIRKALHSMR